MLLRMWATVKGMHNRESIVSVWEAWSDTESLGCTLLEGLHCCKDHHVIGSQTPNLHAAGITVKGLQHQAQSAARQLLFLSLSGTGSHTLQWCSG